MQLMFDLIVCVFSYLLVLTHSQPSCVKNRKSGHRIEDDVYAVFMVDNEHVCYRGCWYSSKCVSYNRNPRTRHCELTTSSMSVSTLVSSAGFTYAEVQSSFCQGSRHACANRPCRETEMCIPVEKATKHICVPFADSTIVTSTTTTTTAADTTTPLITVTSTTTPVVTSTTTISTTATIPTATTATTTTTTPTATTTTTTPATTTTTTTTTTPVTTTTTTTTATTTSAAKFVANISYEYLGCYEYSNDNQLLGSETMDNSLTHEKCATTYCTASDNYFGVSNRKYCFCGATLDVSGHTLKDDSECVGSCKGDLASDYCGQAWRLAVFKL